MNKTPRKCYFKTLIYFSSIIFYVNIFDFCLYIVPLYSYAYNTLAYVKQILDGQLSTKY